MDVSAEVLQLVVSLHSNTAKGRISGVAKCDAQSVA